MCQIQFNYMDIENQATQKGLEYAGKKGIPVVIMEGLLGGKLAKAPDNVQALYDAFPVKRSPVEWAFRWLCNHPEVATVLSGVTSMEQCDDNLSIFDRCKVGVMTEAEEELIARVREAYKSRTKVGMHRMPLLYAMSERRRHPSHFRNLEQPLPLQRKARRKRRIQETLR